MFQDKDKVLDESMSQITYATIFVWTVWASVRSFLIKERRQLASTRVAVATATATNKSYVACKHPCAAVDFQA